MNFIKEDKPVWKPKEDVIDKWMIYHGCGHAIEVNHVEHPFQIKKVIFNEPYTIVIWMDGTKTIVKCQEDDIYDPEKGLAMAISKKALGNKGKYFDTFKKWLPDEEEAVPDEEEVASPKSNEIFEGLRKLINPIYMIY